ncbi:MAG: hypothetical protein HON76_04780 [Candidatus Scalindua sp.]|nr:hypothetical protein [Candidatus Scalindua sp.]MBT6225289.1 hypothetical protein [Candidatus Scalindua sp.]MBT6561825.1 hypothetical protein [Candidatus Scalindua sp.]MBT7350106.1 hypothetical protein [candidate division WWE3 bacterium]
MATRVCDVFKRRACMKHLRERFDTDMKKLKWLQVKNSMKKGMVVSHHTLHKNFGHNLDTLFRSAKMLFAVSL